MDRELTPRQVERLLLEKLSDKKVNRERWKAYNKVQSKKRLLQRGVNLF